MVERTWPRMSTLDSIVQHSNLGRVVRPSVFIRAQGRTVLKAALMAHSLLYIGVTDITHFRCQRVGTISAPKPSLCSTAPASTWSLGEIAQTTKTTPPNTSREKRFL